ncbi:MAG: hypothetical protein WC441_05350 [Patescibacteria group bacterium]
MKKEKRKNILDYLQKALDYFYIIYFVWILIGIAFIFFAGFNEVVNTGLVDTSDMLVVSTALIAINIALGAMVFSYANNLDIDDKNRLVKIGEKFILSSVSFILNLSLTGLIKVGYMDELLNDFSGKKYLVWPLVISVLILSLVAFALFIYGVWKLVSFIIKRK